MKKILITGGAGFIGRNVAICMKQSGYYVCGIGRNSKKEATESLYDCWKEAEITTENLISIGKDFDAIVHCAGSSSVKSSSDYPLQSFYDAVYSTSQLLEYVRIHNDKASIVFVSSAAVYGNKNSPISTSDALDPISIYGIHKKMAEELVQFYSNKYDIKTSIIRFFSIYGAGLKKQLLWDAFCKMANDKAHFFGTGNESRDWIFIDDVADLIHLAILNNKTLLINGGTGIDITNSFVLTMLKEKIESKSEIVFNNSINKSDPLRYCADISDAIKIGWSPKTSIQQGLSIYAEWLKTQ